MVPPWPDGRSEKERERKREESFHPQPSSRYHTGWKSTTLLTSTSPSTPALPTSWLTPVSFGTGPLLLIQVYLCHFDLWSASRPQRQEGGL